MSLREIKRRVTWLWRLASSQLQEHDGVKGEIPALWLFDTARQPDGAVLQPYVEAIARRERLHLHSFGPRPASLAETMRSLAMFASMLDMVVRPDFEAAFAALLRRRIWTATQVTRAAVLLVGSSKGTFACTAAGVDTSLPVWEVQHGLLDSSYFPMQAQRFFVRSRVSAAVVRELAPEVQVDTVSQSLEPPEGEVVLTSVREVSELLCFSKNPGGGCTVDELTEFESACRLAAARHGCRFVLRMHPRDSVLKLLLRHRSLHALSWVRRPLAPKRPRLVVSAHSSALVSESRKGDLIINVRIGPLCPITRREYQWLPTVSIAEIRSLPETIHAFIRTR